MKKIMRIPTMRFGFLAIATGFMILFTGCSQEEVQVTDNENLIVTNNAQTRAPKSRASGQGSLILNDRVQHFSFHVSMDSNGDNVTGSWETNSPGQNIRTHGNFNCMGVIDDETVFAGGVITQVNPDNPFGAVVGDFIYFKVRDNGEGSNAAPDQFSDYFLFGGCSDLNVFMNDIVNGNIQVRI